PPTSRGRDPTPRRPRQPSGHRRPSARQPRARPRCVPVRPVTAERRGLGSSPAPTLTERGPDQRRRLIDGRLNPIDGGDQPRAARDEGVLVSLPLMFENFGTVLPLSRVEHLAGRVEHGHRVGPGHQPTEENALEPRRAARRSRADRQRLDRMPVAENDMAAPGGEVATQQQRPESYGPVADEGAFAQRTDMALRLFSLPRLAS